MKSAVMTLAMVAVGALQAIAAPPTIYNLGHLGGGSSTGHAINASGQVTGESNIIGNVHAFLYTGTPGVDGQMIDLGTRPGGSGSVGYAINASGQVAGATSDGSPYRAFLYTGTPGSGGAMADLGTLPGGATSYAHGINDSGQVVGTSYNSELSDGHAFLYTGTPGAGGVMRPLGALGGTQSAAYAINARGDITGAAHTSSGVSHVFLYTGTPGVDGQMMDLGILPGLFPHSADPIFGGPTPMRDSYGLAINDRGQVAGYCEGGTNSFDRQFYRRAFLYIGTPGVDGQMIDLDAWLDANNPAEGAKWQLNQAYALSNTGLITGLGSYNDGNGGTGGAFLLDASALVRAFRITNVVLSGGNLTVSFPTVTGQTYTLWRSDTLAAGTWINAGLSALPGTGGTLTFSVPAPAAGVFKRFFRVQADPQP